MTDPTEQQLRELFAADAAGAPSEGGLAARALHRVRRRRRARMTAAAGLLAAVVVVGGVTALWGSSEPRQGVGAAGVADCEVFVRFEEITYRAVAMGSFPAGLGDRLGEGDRSDCEDVGPDARGGFFPDAPEQADVWTYTGYDPRQVVAVRAGETHVHVLVAEDLPSADRQRLVDAVRLDAEG